MNLNSRRPIRICRRGTRRNTGIDFEEDWASAAGLQLTPTCKREWNSASGHRGDFMVGCPLAAAAAVLSCRSQPDRWIAPHLAVGTLFDCCRWASRVTQPVSRTPPLWPASWLPAVDKGRSSKSVDVRRVWEVYDERLQFMSRQDALRLDDSLDSMFPVLGWFRLELLRRLLLMLIGSKYLYNRSPCSISTWFISMVTFKRMRSPP